MIGSAEWFHGIQGFEWDEGNRLKNWKKHDVTDAQAEDVFFNRPLVFLESVGGELHFENRFLALGQTGGRRLTVVFTVRENRIRVISARDMSRKERKNYENGDKKAS